MFTSSHAEVSSQALIDLQSDLNKLSGNLKGLYELVVQAMSSLSQEWRDQKFDEFEQEFHSSREMIMELSDKYYEWANQYLPPRIEVIKDIEGRGMGIK